MARGVSGAVNDVDRQIADRHRVALNQPAIGLENLADHAEARAVLGELFDPEPVVLMRPLDRHAQFLRQHPRLSAMVHMAVGHQDFFDLDPSLAHRLLQLVEIAARIDEGRLVGFGAPQQGAILLESGDRHDRCAHRRIGSVHVGDVGKHSQNGKPPDHALTVPLRRFDPPRLQAYWLAP